MEPTFKSDDVALYHGECLEVLRSFESDSVSSIVTDPPAGIAFMGKEWDSFASGNRGVCRKTGSGNACASPGFAKDVHWQTSRKARDRFIAFLTEIMAECLRVAKPGSYALVWAIPRTSHWTGTAIEDAGWVIQDRISHLFGQGFPKHRSKLKPACEDWWLAWKPDRYATPLPGLDGCRIDLNGGYKSKANGRPSQTGLGDNYDPAKANQPDDVGRWPANVTLDEEAAAMLDEASGQLTSGSRPSMRGAGADGYHGWPNGTNDGERIEYGTGGASRFFYVAKAGRTERNAGCEDLPEQVINITEGHGMGPINTSKGDGTGIRENRPRQNVHPTVKPLDLMRWLCRLITPPQGLVLDCFMGSGTTGLAAVEEKFRFIGIEREAAYFDIATKRITAPAGPLFRGVE